MKSTSVKLFSLRTNLKQVTAQIRKPISSSVTVRSLSSTSPSETVLKSQNAQYCAPSKLPYKSLFNSKNMCEEITLT